MNFSRFLGKIVSPTIALLCAGTISILQFSKLTAVTAQAKPVIPKSIYLLESEREKANLLLIKHFPKFGFDNVIANWTFLRFLQYFGDQNARQKTGHALSPEYFEIFVNHNPKFIKPYHFMSPVVSLFAGRPDKSVKFTHQGLQSLSPETSPNAYMLWIFKASDELLFLGDNQAARQSYSQAAEWAQRNPDPEAQRIGGIAAKTAQFLATNPDSKNARISAWLMILHNAVDNEARQRSIAEIQSLGGQVIITKQNTIEIQFPK